MKKILLAVIAASTFLPSSASAHPCRTNEDIYVEYGDRVHIHPCPPPFGG